MERPDFRRAVENVLSGSSAIAGAGLKRPVNFSNDPAMQAVLIQACDNLARNIGVAFQWDDQNLTLLVRRMAAGANMYEWGTADLLREGFGHVSSNLADALIEDPNALSKHQSLPEILKAHDANAAQRIAALREMHVIDTKAPPPEVLAGGKYRLVELKTPQHLKDEATLIGGGCCIANFNTEALREHGLEESDPGADDYMNYAIKMRAGESRNFSLRDAGGGAYATIEYNPKTKSIMQIEGNPRVISPDAAFFPALCEALCQLREHIDLSGGIQTGLPKEERHVLMRSGAFIPYGRHLALEDVLAGQVKITSDMSASEVQALAETSSLELDISDLTPQQMKDLLPEVIKEDLVYSGTEPLILDHVTEISNIQANAVTHASFQALQRAEDMWMDALKQGDFGSLQRAEDMWMDALEQGYFSQFLEYKSFKVPDSAVIRYVDADPHDGWDFDDNALEV